MTQVKIFSAMSHNEVERLVNCFLSCVPNIQVQSIQLSSSAFDTKAMIVYTTEETQ